MNSIIIDLLVNRMEFNNIHLLIHSLIIIYVASIAWRAG